MIRMKQIEKQYGTGKNAVHALRGIDLDIAEGELVAVMGTSGAGKTTLLNIMGCIDTPGRGSYRFEGEELTKYGSEKLAEFRNRNIGFVLQDFGLIGYKTVFDNVAVPLLVGKRTVRAAERKREVLQALERVGMANLARRRAYELSGGQKQRVAIARALVNRPRLILADEPTGNLDRGTSKKILEQFLRIHQAGTTVVIVTHDEEVAGQCERVIRIEDGRLLAPCPEK